jgi:hypothetical protein
MHLAREPFPVPDLVIVRIDRERRRELEAGHQHPPMRETVTADQNRRRQQNHGEQTETGSQDAQASVPYPNEMPVVAT